MLRIIDDLVTAVFAVVPRRTLTPPVEGPPEIMPSSQNFSKMVLSKKILAN